MFDKAILVKEYKQSSTGMLSYMSNQAEAVEIRNVSYNKITFKRANDLRPVTRFIDEKVYYDGKIESFSVIGDN